VGSTGRPWRSKRQITSGVEADTVKIACLRALLLSGNVVMLGLLGTVGGLMAADLRSAPAPVGLPPPVVFAASQEAELSLRDVAAIHTTPLGLPPAPPPPPGPV
jgi:hypothetical protein